MDLMNFMYGSEVNNSVLRKKRPKTNLWALYWIEMDGSHASRYSYNRSGYSIEVRKILPSGSNDMRINPRWNKIQCCLECIWE
jgi:hypothetical protein